MQSVHDMERLLEERGLFHVDLSLTRMEKALKKLGLTRPPFYVVQVLGTNGKGSTSTFLASLCSAHGLVTGLYTSPHFLSFRERIQIHGQDVSDEALLSAFERVLAVEEDCTYFELLTLTALELFRAARVEVAVLEAGLGGAHDATTAVERDLACYTPIALDHTQVLGPTLTDIAKDKSLAISEGLPVLSARQYPAAEAVLLSACQRCHTVCTFARSFPEAFSDALSLQGSHQKENAALALAALALLLPLLGKKQSRASLQKGLHEAFLPGRLQLVQAEGMPPLLLDGAHNPHGMQTMLKALAAGPLRPKALVYACLADKDWPSVARILMPEVRGLPVFFPTLSNDRALPAEELFAYVRRTCTASAPVLLGTNVACVLNALGHMPVFAPHEVVLVTGSLYLLSEVYQRYPDFLHGAKAARVP